MYCTQRPPRSVVAASLFAFLPIVLLHAELSPQLTQSLQRIFVSKDFKPDTFGPAKWIDDGAAFTTLETPQGMAARGKDIVRYDTATGTKSVLVPASELIPPGVSAPLEIDDYAWSGDRSKLFIFTNAKIVWRQKTH